MASNAKHGDDVGGHRSELKEASFEAALCELPKAGHQETQRGVLNCTVAPLAHLELSWRADGRPGIVIGGQSHCPMERRKLVAIITRRFIDVDESEETRLDDTSASKTSRRRYKKD